MAFSRNEISLDYVSIGCNRFSNAADCSPENLVAFGAGQFIALWQLSQHSSRGIQRTLSGHSHTVTTVKFQTRVDEKGTKRTFGLVSGDAGGEVIVWRVVDDVWALSARLKAHKSSIASIGLLATTTSGAVNGGQESGLLLTGASDGTVNVWDLSKAEEAPTQILNLNGKYSLDLALIILPNTNIIVLAVACTDRKLQIWARDSEEFRYRMSLEGHGDWIRCLSFVTEPPIEQEQPMRVILASGSQDGYIRLWTIAQIHQEESKRSGATGGLSNDLLEIFEKSLAEGGQLSTKAHVLVFDSGRYSVTFDALLLGHEGWVTGLHWYPQLQTPSSSKQPLVLLTSASDNSLIMWSQDPDSSIWLNRQRFGDIAGKGMGFFGALWGNDGCDVLAHAWNGSFHRWHIDAQNAEDRVSGSWEPALALTGHSQPVRDVAWEPSGRYVLSCSSDQTSRIHGPWRSDPSISKAGEITWHELARPQIHGYDPVTGAFVNSLRFVSGSDEKVARVFDAPGSFVRTLRASHLVEEAISADDRPAAASVPALGLSNKVVSQEESTAPLDDAALSQRPPVESELALATLWPEIEKIFGHGYELFALAVSPDEKFVATSCKSTTPDHAVIRVYDTTNWKQFGSPLAGHALTITRIAFSPSGRYILSVSRDRSWHLHEFNAEGFLPVASSEKGHARIIWDCAWGSDDNLFVTAARDKTVKIWRRDSSAWKAVATLKLGESATAVDLHSLGESHYVLAVGLETGHIELHTSDNLAEKWKKILVLDSDLAHVQEIHRLRWSPRKPENGSMKYQLASCGDDGSLRIFTIDLHL